MSGEKTAVALALEEQPQEPLSIEQQLDLLGLPDTRNVRLALASSPGGGRPAGSRNKRTLAMADYLLNQYTSPLETLARIQATPVEVLAVRLGCTKLEAMQEIRLAAIALKDHLHSKMPIAVDVTNKREIHLTIVEGLPADEVDNAQDQTLELLPPPPATEES